MIDKDSAQSRVHEALQRKAPSGQNWVVVGSQTRETVDAWIFFYNSKEYIETGKVIHHLAGNGPIFVDKVSGAVEFHGSVPPLEEIIAGYGRNGT